MNLPTRTGQAPPRLKKPMCPLSEQCEIANKLENLHHRKWIVSGCPILSLPPLSQTGNVRLLLHRRVQAKSPASQGKPRRRQPPRPPLPRPARQAPYPAERNSSNSSKLWKTPLLEREPKYLAKYSSRAPAPQGFLQRLFFFSFLSCDMSRSAVTVWSH